MQPPIFAKDRPEIARPPRALLFDSGLGGLSVLAEIDKLRPDLDIAYVADDAAFPYGRLGDGELIDRVEAVLAAAIAGLGPDIVVIACSTASTLALPRLRERWPGLPFVGVVPAVKPAARASRSRLVSVLATRGTIARGYTHALVNEHARECEVTLVGSSALAPIVERVMRGEAADEAMISREIAPCFIDKQGRRTDHVVLACTHFPLLIDFLTRASPWPVGFVDPAPAIARRVDALVGPASLGAQPRRLGAVMFTSGRPPPADLEKALLRRGLAVSPAPAAGVAESLSSAAFSRRMTP